MIVAKTGIQSMDHTKALIDGRVTVPGVTFAFEDVPVVIKVFRRMVRGLEFDIAEMAMTTYLCARAHGKPFTAIPVFPVRAFHHGAILVHKNSGITEPKQLEGRKVGVNRGYTVTTGVWARAALAHDYGVDLSKITFLLSGDEHVAEFRPPANVISVGDEKSLEQMLLDGEIAAAINIQPEHPDIVPLIPNAEQLCFDKMRESGFYPINHTIVVKDALLAAHPDLAGKLFQAFAESKRIFLDNPVGEPGKWDKLHRRVLATGRDPYPYGIEPNRAMLEALTGYAVEQGILPRPVAVESLFAPV